MFTSPDRIVRKSVRREYLVTNVHDETYRGLLVDADERTIILAHVSQIVGADGREVEIAGQVFLPRASIKYMQSTD